MKELDQIYPEYGFARHKGYGTKAHLEALENLAQLGAASFYVCTSKKVNQSLAHKAAG